MKTLATIFVIVSCVAFSGEAAEASDTNAAPSLSYGGLFGDSQIITNSQLALGGQMQAPPVVIERYVFANGGGPADGLGAPFTDTQIITNSRIVSIMDLNVTVKLTNPQQAGAFNGDIYLSLQHSSGFSVLLNRVGRRDGSSLSATHGYGDNGFDVTFDDQAALGDIHVYRDTLFQNNETPIDPTFTLALTGLWAPDGRNTSPLSVLTPDTRTALLDSFNLLSVNGSWTLMAIDYEGGGVSILEQWGFEVVGSTIPEPTTLGLLTVASLALLLGTKNKKRFADRRR